MAYTNNVPQATQTIAFTQPLIEDNFAFLEDSIGQEHNFDATDATKTYHLKASMPDNALSPALPAGTTGVYFVHNGKAFFYDGTNNWRMNQFLDVLSGTFLINSAATVNIAAVPANVVGFGICYKSGGPAVQPFSFFTDGTNCYAFSSRVKVNSVADDYPIEMNNNNAALFVQGARFSATWNGTYTYKIWYRPA